MLPWLLAICLFWSLTAVYLGGMSKDLQGGTGLRQVIGLVDTFVLYLVVWGVLRAVLGGVAGGLGRVVLPTVVTVLLLPVIARVGFGIMGVKLVEAEGH